MADLEVIRDNANEEKRLLAEVPPTKLVQALIAARNDLSDAHQDVEALNEQIEGYEGMIHPSVVVRTAETIHVDLGHRDVFRLCPDPVCDTWSRLFRDQAWT